MDLTNLQGIGIFLVLLYVVEMFPISFAGTCWTVTHRKTVKGKIKVRPIPKRLWLFYKLPIACVCMSHINFFKKYSWTRPVAIATVACFVPRLLMFLPFMTGLAVNNLVFRLLFMFSIPLLLIGLLLLHVLHVAVYFKIMRLFRFGTLSYIVLFVAPYFIAALMNSSIPQQLAEDKETLNSRFDENYKKGVKRAKPTRRSTRNR